MDKLIAFHDVDIQWGNHDLLWIGAAMGNEAMIANVMRQGINYNTYDLLEDGYGINLLLFPCSRTAPTGMTPVRFSCLRTSLTKTSLIPLTLP